MFGTSSNEQAHVLYEEKKLSNEEPWISEDEADHFRHDIQRVRRRTLCGTAGFRPPEQVGERYVEYYKRNGYDEKADYFSLGVTTFTMVAGRRPFPSRKESTQSVPGMSSPSPSRRRNSITGASAAENTAIQKGMRDIEFVSCLCMSSSFVCLETWAYLQVINKPLDNKEMFDVWSIISREPGTTLQGIDNSITCKKPKWKTTVWKPQGTAMVFRYRIQSSVPETSFNAWLDNSTCSHWTKPQND